MRPIFLVFPFVLRLFVGCYARAIPALLCLLAPLYHSPPAKCIDTQI